MYYIIFCRRKFGDSSSNQKMNRQYKKKRQKDKQWSTKHYAEKKTKVIRTQTPLHEHVVPVALGKNRAKKYNHYSKRCAERVKNIASLDHYKERLVLSYKLESKEAIPTDTKKHIGINSCDEMSWLHSIDTY